MKNMPIYEALAPAFAAEGVDTQYVLMGDGNMHGHVLGTARALRLRHGDGLPPRDRQGRRRVGHLRARLHPDHDGAVGGFARDVARELGEQADLVVAIGSSLNYCTVDGGHMFPKAEVVQIDTEPLGLHNGMRVADRYVRADAKLAAAAALDTLRQRGAPKASIRSPELARRIREEPADSAQFPIEPGLLDPRRAIDELDRVIPKDYHSVSGAGHQAYFHSTMRGRKPENYQRYPGVRRDRQRHLARHRRRRGKEERQDGPVRGRRQPADAHSGTGDGAAPWPQAVICVLNDGAYGSEVHKLRADGIDDSGSIFGRTDLAAIARGFGLRGTTVTDVNQFKPLFDAYQAQGTAELWNIHVSDRVVSPNTRRSVGRGHGKM